MGFFSPPQKPLGGKEKNWEILSNGKDKVMKTA